MTIVLRRRNAWITTQVMILVVAGCTAAPETGTTVTTTPTSSTPSGATSAPQVAQPALFYSKAGSLYVSDPAGTPGRKLTDGPADTDPAPSPDLAHLAFIRRANATDYGGQLWVLDLSPVHTPVGKPRRLVDPAAVPPMFGEAPTQLTRPRWSPTGDRIAFLETGEGGGFLHVAAADSGEVVPADQRLFADDGYVWAPDGRHIAWTGGRSDVSPVDVNILAVGATSTVIVADTNASCVTYDNAGQAIVFANGDASSVPGIAFTLRDGGIYSVAAPGGAPANPPAPLMSIFAGRGPYADIAALASGALAFTEWAADGSSKRLQFLDVQSSSPPRKIADVSAEGSGPAWGAGDVVAYVDTSPDRGLIVTDAENRTLRRVDTGVDAFAWP